MRSDLSSSSATSGSWQDIEHLLGFVSQRLREAAHAGDALSAAWAHRSLATVERMRAHLVDVPASSQEVRRYLLRCAAAYQWHRDYQAHWSLVVPQPR